MGTESRRAAADLWPLADPAGRDELAPLLFDSEQERGLALSLARECPSPEFHARVRRLPGSREYFSRLLQVEPGDERGAIHWTLALCAAANERQAPGSWGGLENLIIDLAAEGEEESATGLDALMDAAARAARRLAESSWDVPALAEERFASFLAEVRRVLSRQAARALAFHEAALAARDAGSPLRGRRELGGLFRRVAEGLDESSEALDRFRACSGVLDAARVAADAPWPDGWFDSTLAPPLARALREAERRELAGALEALLGKDLRECNSFAQARRPALYSLLLGAKALPRLVEVAHAKDLEWAPDTIAPHIAAADPRALAPHLLAAEGNGLYGLAEALARPGERPGRVLAAAAERLLTDEDPGRYLDFLLATGAAAALKVLRDAYRPGERELASALLTLADLHGAALPERARLESDEAGATVKGVEVLLRCAACGRSHHYEVSEFLVFMTPEGRDEVSFDRLIRCKRCGAIEDYQLNWRAERQVRLGRRAILGDLHWNDDPAEVAAAARMVKLIKGYSCAGRDFPSLRQAHRHLLAAAQENPRDASAWRRLGSMYLQGGLPDAARKAYRCAVSLDPTDQATRLGLELARRLAA